MNRFLQIICGVIFCLGPVTAFAANGRDLANSIISPDRVLACADELSLTADQRQAIAREQQILRDTTSRGYAETRRATDALLEELSREKPDESIVNARFETLNSAEAILKRARLTATVRLKQILTPEQLGRLQTASSTSHRPAIVDKPDFSGATIPEMLQQVRAGIAEWRQAGRDLTTVNALWDRFRQHAEAREHAQARKTLQELITLLNTAPPAPAP